MSRIPSTKIATLIGRGVHVLVIDLFPPGKHDPDGLHPLIWKDWSVGEPQLPAKPLTLASYRTGADLTAYVEPVAVGDALFDMPVFLMPDRYVNCPLEATYAESWDAFPNSMKAPLE